ncbi:hypothetical protein BS78_06G241300 [Paspalum vaginatum]|nr:hypothetical protein BS78_06G241300 [Paspalum vaginatum]
MLQIAQRFGNIQQSPSTGEAIETLPPPPERDCLLQPVVC